GIGNIYGEVPADQAERAIHRALDLGINCFDVAPIYGKGEAEIRVGKALGKKRKDAIVVTKCGVGYAERYKFRDGRRGPLLESCEKSLTRLGTDYIDVLMVHMPDVTTPFAETMGALDEL